MMKRGSLLRALVALSAFPLPAAAAQIAHIHGRVVSIDSKHGTFLIHHDPFPLMPMAMTMEVKVLRPADLRGLHVGEIVDATVDTALEPWQPSSVKKSARSK